MELLWGWEVGAWLRHASWLGSTYKTVICILVPHLSPRRALPLVVSRAKYRREGRNSARAPLFSHTHTLHAPAWIMIKLLYYYHKVSCTITTQ